MTQVTTLNRGTPAALGTADWPLTGWDIVPAAMLKSLRKRSNGPGLRYFAAHLTALAVTGAFVHLALGTWMVLPAMFAHGTVIVLLFAPLHECSHFTAFRTRWLNYAVGMLVGFISIRPFLYFKWRHAEHHTYTQSPHSDPDHVPSPRSLVQYAGLIVGAELWPKLIGSLWRGATGRYNAQERRFIPTSELDRVSASFVPPALNAGIATAAPHALQALNADEQLAYARWLKQNVAAHKNPALRAVTLSFKRLGQAPGDATAKQLDIAADLADQFSAGEVRVTHDQNLLLPWVNNEQLPALWAAARQAGLANSNIRLLTDMIACPGGDFCALANARSLPIAEAITERYQDMDELHDLGEIDLHISGCINSCGHHHSGHIGILGVDKDGKEWYQVSLGGSDGSTLSGASVAGKVVGPSFGAAEVPDVIEALLDTYRSERQNGETFIATFKRVGIDTYKAAANQVRHSAAAEFA